MLLTGCLEFHKKLGAVSTTCLVLESWHGNSSSFTLHKLHFHCDSRARPAWQPIASLTINLISGKAVHLFVCEGIEILMKWLLLKSSPNSTTVCLCVHAGFHSYNELT